MMCEKAPMSLEDYVRSSADPEWFFEEDKDYIIYRGLKNWGKDTGKMAFLIDRDNYFAVREDTSETVFFDMLNVEYATSARTKRRLGGTRVKFGNFFYRDDEASFFLTEPKNADDILIYRKNMGMYAYEGKRWPGEDGEIVKFSFADYSTTFVVLPIQALMVEEQAVDKCQSEFYDCLRKFRDGKEYRLGFLSS